MTQEVEKKWQQAIRDAESLEASAGSTDQYVWYMTDALTLTLKQLYTDSVNGEIKKEDKEDLMALINKIKDYAIQRNHSGLRIGFTTEWAEINDILKEVF